jgi:hypothetical protein
VAIHFATADDVRLGGQTGSLKLRETKIGEMSASGLTVFIGQKLLLQTLLLRIGFGEQVYVELRPLFSKPPRLFLANREPERKGGDCNGDCRAEQG